MAQSKEIVPRLIRARRQVRKEMIEWICSHPLIEPDEDSVTRFEPFYQIEKKELRDYEEALKKHDTQFDVWESGRKVGIKEVGR